MTITTRISMCSHPEHSSRALALDHCHMSVDSKINQKHNGLKSKGAVDCMKYCYSEIWLKEYNVGNCCLITEMKLTKGCCEESENPLRMQRNYRSQLEVFTLERSVANSPVSGCGISLSFVVALFIEEAFQLQKKIFIGYIFVATVKIEPICYQMSYCLATKWTVAWHSFGHGNR